MKEEFSTNTRRWYDRDPVLSSAMKTLEQSDDETQIKVALNLIKIITEHNISNAEYESVEDIVSSTEDVSSTEEMSSAKATTDIVAIKQKATSKEIIVLSNLTTCAS